MSLTQQIILAARIACAAVAHEPRADVMYHPSADVTINPGPAIDTNRMEVPVTVDVLRGRVQGNRPLLGEVPLGTATIEGAKVTWKGTDGKAQPLADDCKAKAAPARKPARR